MEYWIKFSRPRRNFNYLNNTKNKYKNEINNKLIFILRSHKHIFTLIKRVINIEN